MKVEALAKVQILRTNCSATCPLLDHELKTTLSGNKHFLPLGEEMAMLLNKIQPSLQGILRERKPCLLCCVRQCFLSAINTCLESRPSLPEQVRSGGARGLGICIHQKLSGLPVLPAIAASVRSPKHVAPHR